MNCYNSIDPQTCLELIIIIRIDTILKYVKIKTWWNTLKLEEMAKEMFWWQSYSLNSARDFWTKLNFCLLCDASKCRVHLTIAVLESVCP
jgi:hypothetical protein